MRQVLSVLDLALVLHWSCTGLFTGPGHAWDAALKIAKVQLELLSDADMLLMIESDITEGIATISHR